ncbi:hypothetical protein HYQ44_001008 [Verticillium longisporum]|nr:hypothetical protein HYQ44_001008 [Verticillium longisporum]
MGTHELGESQPSDTISNAKPVLTHRKYMTPNMHRAGACGSSCLKSSSIYPNRGVAMYQNDAVSKHVVPTTTPVVQYFFIVRDVLSDHTSVSVHPSLHRGVTPIAPLYPCLAEPCHPPV